jgi:hypothetical protein
VHDVHDGGCAIGVVPSGITMTVTAVISHVGYLFACHIHELNSVSPNAHALHLQYSMAADPLGTIDRMRQTFIECLWWCGLLWHSEMVRECSRLAPVWFVLEAWHFVQVQVTPTWCIGCHLGRVPPWHRRPTFSMHVPAHVCC